MSMFEGKKVLVVGLARSGQSAVKMLFKLGAEVWANDGKAEDDLQDALESIDGCYAGLILGTPPVDIEDFDMMVLSPGVPLDKPFVQRAYASGVEVVGELELAYRLACAKFVAITGTNGKTTTTALTGEIFKQANRSYHVVGNIGVPVIDRIENSDEQTVLVTEVSSFQLETIHEFKPSVAAILNLTPDHLNRHKTMENYIDAKCRIFENQHAEDVLLLNYDDELTRQLKSRSKSRVIYFSRKEMLDEGIFVMDGKIVVKDLKKGDEWIPVVDVADIFIPGDHNVENALAAVGLTYYSGIDIENIASALKTFKGVEHRIEWLGEIDDIVFYNDSKGTNPDASIVAIKAMERPTVLIAGGMDKGSVFDSFINAFGKTVKKLVLFGETASMIEETAHKYNFENVQIVTDLEEAVNVALESSESGDAVLLSPACASWDMYPSYEHRGAHFKSCFEALRGREV